MPFPTRPVCLVAVAALSVLFVACGGAPLQSSSRTNRGPQGIPETVAPPAFSEADDGLQVRRKAALEDARRTGVLGECDTFHNSLRVKAPFYLLPREDQRKLADIAFALCFRLPVDAPQEQVDRLEFRGLHLEILNDRTGQRVGMYAPTVGLSLD